MARAAKKIQPEEDDESGEVVPLDMRSALSALDKGEVEWSEASVPSGEGWQPDEEGEELIGIFAGSEIINRYRFHGVAVTGEDGKPQVVRVKGVRSLKRMSRIQPGTPVKLVFKGWAESDAGKSRVITLYTGKRQ